MDREAEVESCFSCDVDFHYPKSIGQFGDLLEVFKACSRTAEKNDNTSLSDNEFFGENTTRDQHIAKDDVSGLNDESKKIASFLIVARKFNYTCVYIFLSRKINLENDSFPNYHFKYFSS